MKAQFANELAIGATVDSMFSLRSKEMRAARNGDAYLALELADRSGQIPAVLFRPRAEASVVPVGGVVHVRGTVTSFRNIKRISIESLRAAETWDPEDLLCTSTRPREDLVADLKRIVASVNDLELRKLLRAIMSDRSFFERFTACPAAQTHHHAYLGGLLEHTVSVAGLCSMLAEQYPGVQRDILITAAVLHDVGKVDELRFDTSIEYTDRGRLVGHVVMGVMLVREVATRARIKLPADRYALLEHAMLSHHGELEWGSPKRPCTMEALLLHHADNLDAKAAGLGALLGAASTADEAWTDAGNLFRRPLYAPRPFEEDRPHHAMEDELTYQRTA